MTSALTQVQQPFIRKNALIGITHTPEGDKILREPRVLKVGIGLPRGKAADVYVNADGKWVIRCGKYDSNKKLVFETMATVDTMAEAEAAFRTAWKKADNCTYPRKISYFAFTRPVMGENGEQVYVPDFPAIQAHSFADGKVGTPTEIDVIFLDDEPFTGGYANWSSSELRCSGDGINAMRSVAMYESAERVPEELRAAWLAAKAAGEKTFPVVNGCWTRGCPFSKEVGNKPSPCKPSLDLKFQLARNIRVGGTAFFHTSGYKSIVQVFSAVERIKQLTGGKIAGIPLKMTLRSHKTNHNGQAAIQQNVSLEFRSIEEMDSVRKTLIEQAWKFRDAAGLESPRQTRMLEAPEDLPSSDSDFGGQSHMSAQAMADEFYPDNDEATEEAIPVAAEALAVKTQEKVASMADKLATPPLWPNRKVMAEAFIAMKNSLGEEVFQSTLKSHGLMLGTAKHDDPKVAECYRAMVAQQGQEQGSAQQEDAF